MGDELHNGRSRLRVRRGGIGHQLPSGWQVGHGERNRGVAIGICHQTRKEQVGIVVFIIQKPYC